MARGRRGEQQADHALGQGDGYSDRAKHDGTHRAGRHTVAQLREQHAGEDHAEQDPGQSLGEQIIGHGLGPVRAVARRDLCGARVQRQVDRPGADISVESIAARAGVHKTTVYRRWGSKEEIIRQALVSAALARIQVPDTGSVDTDLRMLARAVQAVISVPEGAAISRD